MALWGSAGHWRGRRGAGQERACSRRHNSRSVRAQRTKTAATEELRGAHGIMSGVSPGGEKGTGRGRKESKRGQGGLDPEQSRE